MDIMEKVEQLREKADISYEEARAVKEGAKSNAKNHLNTRKER